MRKDTLKHIVKCPNCKKDVLDHMLECPYCKSKLEPKYKQSLSEKEIKKIKLITNIIGFSIAVIVIIVIIYIKNK